MTTSQNGWPAIASYGDPSLTAFPWVSGDVLRGDTWDVFDYLCRRFDAEVQPIRKAASWGYSPRNIIGSFTTLSNHASGTAIDLNADAHPLGATGTFSAAQVARIHSILTDCVVDGVPVIRWGGDYSGRKDEMHFELNLMSNGNSPAKLAALASRVRAGLSTPSADALAAVVKTATPAASGLPILRKGTDGGAPGQRLKAWLHAMYSYAAGVDGSVTWIGDDAWSAMTVFARRVGLLGAGETLDAWGPKCWAAAKAQGFRG